MDRVIVTCALTGAQQGKDANPHLPEQPDEIIAQGLEAWRAGAAVLHLHARNAAGKATSDVEIFRRIVEGESWAAFGFVAAEAELARGSASAPAKPK